MVIAAQCMFVSEAKIKTRICQAGKQSGCVAVVPITGRESRGALPPGKGGGGGELCCTCCQSG